MKHFCILVLSLFMASCANNISVKSHTHSMGDRVYPDYFVLINDEYIAIPKNKLDEFTDNFRYRDFEKVTLYENRDKFIRIVKWNDEKLQNELQNYLWRNAQLDERSNNILNRYIFLTKIVKYPF